MDGGNGRVLARILGEGGSEGVRDVDVGSEEGRIASKVPSSIAETTMDQRE